MVSATSSASVVVDADGVGDGAGGDEAADVEGAGGEGVGDVVEDAAEDVDGVGLGVDSGVDAPAHAIVVTTMADSRTRRGERAGASTAARYWRAHGVASPVMTGTLINVAAIVGGAGLGVLLGGRLPERVRGALTDLLGLFVVVLGVSDALTTFGTELSGALGRAAVLVVLGSLLLGGIVGELLDIEGWLTRVGAALRDRVLRGESQMPEPSGPDRDVFEDVHAVHDPQHRFVEGFVVTTLIVCVGPLAILGALQDGLTGDVTLLAVKGMLDGAISVAFASVLGVGVAFAALPLLVWQGGLTLAASALGGHVTEPMLAALTAVGGILVLGIGLRLLEIRAVRVANLLPALVLAPLAVALWP